MQFVLVFVGLGKNPIEAYIHVMALIRATATNLMRTRQAFRRKHEEGTGNEENTKIRRRDKEETKTKEATEK